MMAAISRCCASDGKVLSPLAATGGNIVKFFIYTSTLDSTRQSLISLKTVSKVIQAANVPGYKHGHVKEI
jgi:hypothetical protein